MTVAKKIHSDYLDAALDGSRANKTLAMLVDTIERIRDGGVKFDAIAFSGISGAIFAGAIAAKFNVSLILIRKRSDNSHSCDIMEGVRGDFDYLILDDFISTGKTIKKIIKAIDKENVVYSSSMGGIVTTHCTANCKGIVLWNTDRTTPFVFRGEKIPVWGKRNFKQVSKQEPIPAI